MSIIHLPFSILVNLLVILHVFLCATTNQLTHQLPNIPNANYMCAKLHVCQISNEELTINSFYMLLLCYMHVGL